MSADKALEGLEEQRKRKRGGQTLYTPEIADEVCNRIAEGESLSAICRNTPHMPAEATIRLWVVDDREGFAARYARARDVALDKMADELIEIADESNADVIVDADGHERLNGEAVQRARLRVDTRKWYMSKLAPKRYGDKLHHEHSGTVTLSALLLGAEEPAVRVIEGKAEPPEGEDAG